MPETLAPNTVAGQAADRVAEALRGQPPVLAHCLAMLGEFGIIQFAHGTRPDPSSGYCTDDNARALLVAVNTLLLDPANGDARRIGEITLASLELAQLDDGSFHNLMDEHGEFVADGGRSEDAVARAIWALGVTVRRTRDKAWRARATALLEKAWHAVAALSALRPRAYALLGATACASRIARARDVADSLAARLLEEFEAAATDDWGWWEPVLTWGNARVPHAMLRAALITGSEPYRACGLRALEFLGGITQPDDLFIPIGNDGWYPRGGRRALYDQQPIEACAMVDAWLAAADLTGERAYRRQALHAFYWYFGVNTEGLTVAQPDAGACHDGLHRGEVNVNMGAESTLSYLLAHGAIARDSLGLAP
jgi:hypothetical protein